MKKIISSFFIAFIVMAFSSHSTAEEKTSANPIAVIQTSKGPITLELFADKSPISVANFISYAKSGHYNNTIFHRVKKRFMIQGGGFTKLMERKESNDPIVNESGNGLHNDRWTIAMARTDDPDSATAQFFINVKMNSRLDAGRGKPGYAVFGIVTDGFYVVKAIEKTATMTFNGYDDVPVEPIMIESVTIQ